MKLAPMVAVLLTSCAGVSLLRGSAMETPDIAKFIAGVREDEAKRVALSADGSIRLQQSVAQIKARVGLAVDPKRVRLDVSTDAGNVLFALASNGERVGILNLERREFIGRAAGPGDLAAINLPSLDTRALGLLLLARSPCDGPPSGADATHLEWRECLGGTLLATYSRNPNGHAYLRAMELTVDKTQTFNAKLIGHTTSGLARRVEIETKEASFVVQLEELDEAPVFDEDLFDLQAPPGVRTIL
jgi:hypothetical protein